MPKQLNLRLSASIPPHIKAKLADLRADCVRRNEEHRRKLQVLERAERYETWQEVKLTAVPLKGRR